MAVPVLLRKERYRDRDRDRQRARDRAWDRSTIEFSALVSYKLTGSVFGHQISGSITCTYSVSVLLPGTWRCCSRTTTQIARHNSILLVSSSTLYIYILYILMVWNDMKHVLLVVATRWSRTWPLVLAPSHQGSRPIPPEPPVDTTEAEQRYRGPRQRQGCQGQIGQEDRKIGMRILKFNHSNDNRVIIDSKKFPAPTFLLRDQNPSGTLSEQYLSALGDSHGTRGGTSKASAVIGVTW